MNHAENGPNPVALGKAEPGDHPAVDERWIAVNLSTINAWNDYVERNGIPYIELGL